jgi:HSP20 family protein
MKDNEKERMELERMTPETNPFRMMRRFTKDMEGLFEGIPGFGFPTFFRKDFRPFLMEFDKMEWLPQLEVIHNNGQFIVRADLPGLTKDDVIIEVTNDVLTIRGERKAESEEKREGFFRTERMYGSFYRQVPLPEGVKTENAVATFTNGVLEITMPAATKVEPEIRKLEIKEPIPAQTARAAGA